MVVRVSAPKTYTMYLDETGDPNLVKINPQYPVFALGGIIVEDGYEPTLQADLDSLKLRVFGGLSMVLHSTDVRKQRKAFNVLGDLALRELFYTEFNDFVLSANVTFISVLVEKDAHARSYKTPYHPYHWLLELMLERFARFLGSQGATGRIIAESRGKKEDGELRAAFDALIQRGCEYVSAASLKQLIHPTLDFELKSANRVGMQVCDMMLYPVAKAVMSNDPTNAAFHVVVQKMHPWYGCRVLPSTSQPKWIPHCFQISGWLLANHPSVLKKQESQA